MLVVPIITPALNSFRMIYLGPDYGNAPFTGSDSLLIEQQHSQWNYCSVIPLVTALLPKVT